jgi:hypothetical protein
MKQDICQWKIKNWMAFVQDRGKRKEFINTLLTGDADLRLYITTVQDG